MKKTPILKVIIVAAALSLLAAGCTAQGFSFNFSSNNNIRQEDETTVSVELNSAKSLYIENQTGNVTLGKSSDNNVTVKTKIRVEGQVTEEVEKVLKEMKTYAETKDGKLEIRAVCSDGSDFWRWKQDHYRMLNVSINFDVSIPQNLDSYKLRLITGNINFKDLNGALDIENITGNITVDNAKLGGQSHIQLITGNVDVDGSIADADRLDINNTTGNITLRLPGDSNLKLQASIVTGIINGSLIGNSAVRGVGGTSIDKEIGSGKTDTSIKLITGNITIDKK